MRSRQLSEARHQLKNKVIVYWLIPAEPERELFRGLIKILAKQFDAPVFEPHLTLCIRPDRRGEKSPRRLLRQIKASGLRLQVRGVSHASKFTKTLFVRFKPARALDKLAREFGCAARSDPHVSLLYKHLPARTKKELAATIQLRFRSVRFDSIKAVRCTSPTTMTREVKAWRVIATKRFGERTRPRVQHSAPPPNTTTHLR
jgi:hypothetical protein